MTNVSRWILLELRVDNVRLRWACITGRSATCLLLSELSVSLTANTTCIFVQRAWHASAKDQLYSVCPDIRASGQVVSEPTAVRRGSGRVGLTEAYRILTGIPTSQVVSDVTNIVCRWRPSTTAISNGRLSTVNGCYVHSVNSTFD